MSAIAGIFRFDGVAIEPDHIDAMIATMIRRGPDGSAKWIDRNAALGHCMLHTTTESLQEQQPWTAEDAALVLVYDGRLDNYQALRQQLLARGTVLRNSSDAELLLRAWQEWGSDCLRHVEGDFALLVWDKQHQRVFCARDRIGTKPLHYWWNGTVLCVASTLDALLTLPWVPRVANHGFLAEVLLSNVTCQHETFWQGVLRLPAAHSLQVTDGKLATTRYWQPDVWQRIRYRRDEEYHEHYRALLADVVRDKSRSHRPLAIEVSGGLDSSAVFAMAKHLERQGQLPAPAIRAYTLAFTGDAPSSDLRYARAVGAHWQHSIAEIPPTYKHPQWYQALATRWRDFPNHPNGIMSLGLYEQARADGCRLLLSGWGGDYWLDGSRSCYADLLQERQWQRWYQCLQTDSHAFGALTALRWAVGYGFLPLLPFGVRSWLRRQLTRITGAERSQHGFWLSPAFRSLIRDRQQQLRLETPQMVARPGQRGQLNQLADHHFLYAHEQTEHLVSEQGLETVDPLADPRIVQFAFATPEHVRRSGRLDRACHRAAMTGILPDLVTGRLNKADFDSTFLYHLTEMADLLVKEIPSRHPDWVSSSGVAHLFNSLSKPHEFGDAEWGLWALCGCDGVFAPAPGEILKSR